MQAAIETLNEIADRLENMQIDVEDAMEEQLDTAMVELYTERFKLFVLDRCPAAIIAYMNKASRDSSLNTITKLHIMSDATKALDNKF